MFFCILKKYIKKTVEKKLFFSWIGLYRSFSDWTILKCKHFSRFKEELDMTELMQEASTGEHQSLFPADPECSSVGAQLIASRLCLCTQKTQIFVTASENGKLFFYIL